MAMLIEYDHPKNECLTVSVTDAARIWGFSPQTVYNAIKSGEIKAIRISEKRMRISKKEVERVLPPYLRSSYRMQDPLNRPSQTKHLV